MADLKEIFMMTFAFFLAFIYVGCNGFLTRVWGS